MIAQKMTWCVAHTQPLKEHVAKQHLLEQGFDVYLPRFKKIRRHARKVEEVLVPLFPRYIFVGMGLDVDPWRSVNGTRGVSHLLMQDATHPAKVPCSIIDDLKSQEVEEGIVIMNSTFPFSKGDRVRVMKGGFRDQVATFDKLDDKSRVLVLLSLLGREVKMSLSMDAVEAA